MAEEPRILCVIRDMIDPQTAGTKMSINLPASTSIGDVIDEIAKTTKYIASSINIKYNKQVSCELEEVGISTNIEADWVCLFSGAWNCIGGVMVSVLASSVVDRGFESRLGQTKNYKIGICCFSVRHAA